MDIQIHVWSESVYRRGGKDDHISDARSKIKKAEGSWRSVFGKYVCAWNWKSEQEVVCNIEVPFNANARFILPDGTEEILDCGKYEKILNMRP